MTEMAGTPIPHAPGFIANTTPRIVTSRFDYEDSYTLARYEATGGYQGLKKALQQTPEEVHSEVRDATLLGPRRSGIPSWSQMGILSSRSVATIPGG